MSGDGEQYADAAGHLDADPDWREVRERLGLSRSRFAAKLGVSNVAVRRWEVGDQSPSIAYQEQLEDLLEDATPDGCGCPGCFRDPIAVIDHPEKGERTVCKQHINGHPVIRRFARV